MRAYPEDHPDMDLLEQVSRRLSAPEAERVLALPREDFLTWIDAYLTLRREGVALDPKLQKEFLGRVLVEAQIDLTVPELQLTPEPLLAGSYR